MIQLAAANVACATGVDRAEPSKHQVYCIWHSSCKYAPTQLHLQIKLGVHNQPHGMPACSNRQELCKHSCQQGGCCTAERWQVQVCVGPHQFAYSQYVRIGVWMRMLHLSVEPACISVRLNVQSLIHGCGWCVDTKQRVMNLLCGRIRDLGGMELLMLKGNKLLNPTPKIR